MRCFGLEVFGQVDDRDGVERTFLIDTQQTRQQTSSVSPAASQCEAARKFWTRQLARAQRLTLTQMPQPMHSSSEIHAVELFGVTSMQILPVGRRRCAAHESARARRTLTTAAERAAAARHASVDALLTHTHNRTKLFALLSALARLALVDIDNRDTRQTAFRLVVLRLGFLRRPANSY